MKSKPCPFCFVPILTEDDLVIEDGKISCGSCHKSLEDAF